MCLCAQVFVCVCVCVRVSLASPTYISTGLGTRDVQLEVCLVNNASVYILLPNFWLNQSNFRLRNVT